MKENLRNTITLQIHPFIIALFGCLFLYIAFPGDIPWINDEPMLIKNALKANSQHALAKSGLRGSVGIQYGPLPTWVYQFFLLFSKNPIHVGMMKNILSFITLAGGLLYFAHRMKLSLWPLLLVFFSPYVYFYNRLLWDNVFMIPLSLFLWCSALSFWLYKDRWAFVVGIVLSVVLLHIHLMAVLTIIPFGLTIIAFDRSWLHRNLCFVLFWIFMGILTILPYLLSLDFSQLNFVRSNSHDVWYGIWEVFTGARFFSFVGFGDYFIPEIFGPTFFLTQPLTCGVVFLTALVFIPWILGLSTGVTRLIRKIMEHDDWDTEDRLLTLALVTILLSAIFFTLTRQYHHPHYQNGVWFAYFYLIWRCLDNTIKKFCRFTNGLLTFHGTIMGCMLVSLILFIHSNGGNRGIHYGPTLSNQIRVAKSILEYSHLSRIHNAVPNYNYFPHALFTLIELFHSDKSTHNLPIRHIYLQHDKDPHKGSIYMTVSEQPLHLQEEMDDQRG